MYYSGKLPCLIIIIKLPVIMSSNCPFSFFMLKFYLPRIKLFALSMCEHVRNCLRNDISQTVIQSLNLITVCSLDARIL
jgi:hypothetical protein